MSRSHTKQALFSTVLCLAAAAHASEAPVARASDWLGHAVTTRDGKELGTVRDFGIDERSGKIVYIVVSVGSFLIENNLIAVAPDALVPSRTEDGVLLLEADPKALREAKRFASDSHWPDVADVVRGDGGPSSEPAEPSAHETPATTAAPAPTGTATIESGSKTAHLSANERVITETPGAAKPPTPPTQGTATPQSSSANRPPPITVFDKLDKDGDGVLNRSEFAHVISPKDNYSKIDANANGVIDPDEFDAYEQSHGQTN